MTGDRHFCGEGRSVAPARGSLSGCATAFGVALRLAHLGASVTQRIPRNVQR
jgi:hypothetical protein